MSTPVDEDLCRLFPHVLGNTLNLRRVDHSGLAGQVVPKRAVRGDNDVFLLACLDQPRTSNPHPQYLKSSDWIRLG